MAHTIAVFGCGIVGGTVANYLEEHGTTVIRVDPKLYPFEDPWDAVMNSDGIVVAVPTPSSEDGTCDDTMIKQVLSYCDARTKVLIKSTVTPDLLQNYDVNVVYNPEFLREAHAKEDFKNQHTFILGHHKNNLQDAEWWADVFNRNMTECVFTNRRTASMIKYTHNAWLATKVAWFHELYDNLPPEVDYDAITSALGRFPTIGSTHMQAPNSEGGLGYSGACFPKDVKALTNVVNHSILSTVKETNNKLNSKGE